MSHNENPMAGHDVDGIKELDNLLPRWWVWLFNITIAFSVVYMVYYHVIKDGNAQAAQYAREMARAKGAPTEQAVAAAPAAEEPASDPAILSKGKAIYGANCAVCHAADGGGLIGPNLTDEYYIHGATFADSLHIIREGVPAKGMISWKATLRPDDIYALGSYIYSLRGTTPAAAKAPEGVKAES